MTALAQSDNTSKGLSAKTMAKVACGVVGASALGITLISASFLSPAFRRYCLPFVPATSSQIENVLSALRFCTSSPSSTGTAGTHHSLGGLVVDLGSGDGRIVFAAAKEGYMTHGIEINRWLTLYSRINARTQKLNKLTKFYTKNLWKADLSIYRTVIIFGTETLMKDLSTKLAAELHPGSYVIACRFPADRWMPIKTIGTGIDQVWVYSLPTSIQTTEDTKE